MSIEIMKAVKGISWKHLGIFVAGTLAGSYGADVLGNDKAKKVYTEAAALGLRVKDEVLKQTTNLQENATDILEDAKALNEERAEKSAAEAAEEVFEDLANVESEEKTAPKKPAAKKPAAKKSAAKKPAAKKPAAKKSPAKK